MGERDRRGAFSARPRGSVLARLIVDTSALIAVERGRSKLIDVVSAQDDVAIAAITAAELLVGVELATPTRRDERAGWVEGLLTSIPVEDYDLDVAREHASLLAYVRRAGGPRGAHDLIVAATARARERTVVTTDDRGFSNLPAVSVRIA